MHGTKGSPFDMVMPMKGTFHEVVTLKRLVFSVIAIEDANGNALLETSHTLNLEEHQRKTKLRLLVKVFTAAPEAAGAVAGLEQDWLQSLENYLFI